MAFSEKMIFLHKFSSEIRLQIWDEPVALENRAFAERLKNTMRQKQQAVQKTEARKGGMEKKLLLTERENEEELHQLCG